MIFLINIFRKRKLLYSKGDTLHKCLYRKWLEFDMSFEPLSLWRALLFNSLLINEL